jgi:hypothetical protein
VHERNKKAKKKDILQKIQNLKKSLTLKAEWVWQRVLRRKMLKKMIDAWDIKLIKISFKFFFNIKLKKKKKKKSVISNLENGV